jgi:CheY-like chemotaxis protein
MRRRRALVFDDEPLILDFFKQYLSSLGYDVVALTEPVVCPLYADNAVRCDRREPCADVVITEHRMPRMNGLALLKAQASRGCRLTPGNKALLSGYLEPDAVAAVRRMGCAFFDKPIHLSRFEAWLTACEKRMDLSQPLGERRRENRVPAANHRHYLVQSESDRIECRAMNVSANGFCLNVPLPLEREQVVQVASASPVAPRTALVRWTRRQQDGFYQTGLSCC